MINEQDIALIEKYLFGKCSEEEKTAFEQHLKNNKEFADEVNFMRDLKISSREFGKNELRSKLKIIAQNYKANEIKQNSSLKNYLAIAASIAVFIGIAALLYMLNSKNINDTNNIAGLKDTTNSTALNRLIESSAINTKMVNINSIEGAFGYVQTDSIVTNKFPVLVIHSEKYANTYLYRDTLFLFLPTEDNLSFYSLSEQPNILCFSQEKESFYYIELKKGMKLTPIKKVDDNEVVNRIKKFVEKN